MWKIESRLQWVRRKSTRKRIENISERNTDDLVAVLDLGNERADATIRQKILIVFEKGEREKGIVTQGTYTITHPHPSLQNIASEKNQVSNQAFWLVVKHF